MLFFKNLNTKEIPIFETLLKNYDEEYVKNYLIEDCFLVNVYLPKRFLHNFFINSHNFFINPI